MFDSWSVGDVVVVADADADAVVDAAAVAVAVVSPEQLHRDYVSEPIGVKQARFVRLNLH